MRLFGCGKGLTGLSEGRYFDEIWCTYVGIGEKKLVKSRGTVVLKMGVNVGNVMDGNAQVSIIGNKSVENMVECFYTGDYIFSGHTESEDLGTSLTIYVKGLEDGVT